MSCLEREKKADAMGNTLAKSQWKYSKHKLDWIFSVYSNMYIVRMSTSGFQKRWTLKLSSSALSLFKGTKFFSVHTADASVI